MKQIFLGLVTTTFLLALAGPELGLGMELIGLMDLLGIELFLFCFAAPIMFYWFMLEDWFCGFDPYYFIPTLRQVRAHPGLIAHAIPGYVVALFWVASIPFIVT